MSLGLLESIAASQESINSKLDQLLASGAGEPGTPADADTSADEEKPKRGRGRPAGSTGKKVAAKKTAAKKTAAKKNGNDFSELVVFKKALIKKIEELGVPEPMVALKKFIISQEYASSDEIEEVDRQDFFDALIAHFSDESGDGDEEDLNF